MQCGHPESKINTTTFTLRGKTRKRPFLGCKISLHKSIPPHKEPSPAHNELKKKEGQVKKNYPGISDAAERPSVRHTTSSKKKKQFFLTRRESNYNVWGSDLEVRKKKKKRGKKEKSFISFHITKSFKDLGSVCKEFIHFKTRNWDLHKSTNIL